MIDQGRVLGRSLAFPPGLNNESRMAWSVGAENIRQSIRIILSTEPGERLMLPDFGAGLKKFLYEPNTASTHRLIEDRISQSLEIWEPRIRLDSIDVNADETDAQAVWVVIQYSLVANRTAEQLRFRVQLAS
ncbi:MAG TPA: phage tail protein [Gammaproteobacteria bacterium]|nr:phage tail protein [Gammaproteobacteria bacterium]